jgi:hypothetical protein
LTCGDGSGSEQRWRRLRRGHARLAGKSRRADLLVVDRQHRAGAAEAGLHLVGDHEHLVARAQLAHAAQVALVGHHDARLALDRLEHEGGHVRVGGERRL